MDPNLSISFYKIQQFSKFEGADFKYDNIFYNIFTLKYLSKAFLVQVLNILIVQGILQFDKLEGIQAFIQAFSIFSYLQFDKFDDADFNYDNTKIMHFQSQIQAFLFFVKILVLDKFQGADFKIDKSFFKFQPKNIQINRFWSYIQKFLFLSQKFAVKQIRVNLFQR